MIQAIVSALMALLIIARCAQVLNDTSLKTRDRTYVSWEIFTLAYCVLGLAAGIAAFLIGVGALSGVPSSGVAVALVRRFRDVLWIGASLLLASAWAVRPSSVRDERLGPAEP